MDESRLLTDLQEFVSMHRAHGELQADADAPTANGYRLQVTCPCGIVFERWVLPQDAVVDLVLLARWD